MVFLCFLAVAAALGGLATVGLAIGPAAGPTTAILLLAPLLGSLSLASGLAAAVIALRRP